MTMHDGGVSSANDVLVVEDSKLCLELAHGVDGVRGACKHEAGADFLVVNAAEADAHVVTADGVVHLVLHLIVDGGDLNVVPIRHEQEIVALAQVARLDLADDDRAHVLVLLGDRHHQRRVDLAVDHRHLVEVAKERWATRMIVDEVRRIGQCEASYSLPPRANILRQWILEVGASVCRYRDEGDVCLDVETGCPDERCDLVLNLVEPGL